MKKPEPKIYASPSMLAFVLSTDKQKLKQVKDVVDRTWLLTTGEDLDVTVEVMEQNIIRYTIEGTRCSVRVCWSIDQQKIIRQPRGLKRNELFDACHFCQYGRGLVAEAKERIVERDLAEEVADTWMIERARQMSTNELKNWIWMYVNGGSIIECLEVEALRKVLIERGEDGRGYHNT